jgi:hypothetical protein
MIPMMLDYAMPSVFESARDRDALDLAANARRPVRFHGRAIRNIPMLRFAMRALGEAIWSSDLWASEGEYMAWTLDPVITVHPDRIFLEAFSQDQSVYAALILNPAMFETEGEVRTGTTNVDFSAWLWGALGEMRSSRETWFRVEAGGFEVKTNSAGGRFEQTVELPESWVRGFLQTSGAMAMPGTRLEVKPVDLLSAIRYLRYTKAKVSPRALRYEFIPRGEAKLILEPWEHEVRLRGVEHNYTEPRVIRTWGRRRLKFIEGLLPFAERVDIYLKGRALPSFYAVKLPDMTFVVGLSGWSEQGWSGTSFELLTHGAPPGEKQLQAVADILRVEYVATAADLAKKLGKPLAETLAACERLCRLGRAMFDVEARAFRHRELFEFPIDEAKLFPPDDRAIKARELIMKGTVGVISCERSETRKVKKLKTPDGPIEREIVYREWRVEGRAGDQARVEAVVADTGRILFGVCGCAFFRENILNKGPCEHMLAILHVSGELRKDAASSVEVPPGMAKSHYRNPVTGQCDADEESEGDEDSNGEQAEDADEK